MESKCEPEKDSIEEFSLKEDVLCWNRGFLYKAKITKIDSLEKRYFVHYVQWNHRYDEWVDSSSLLKLNEANIELQKKQFEQVNEVKEKRKDDKKRKKTNKEQVVFIKVLFGAGLVSYTDKSSFDDHSIAV